MPKDPLCPLGFHPQTRWPTRCKRCFREYKEHAPKNDDKKDLSSRHDLEFRRRTPFPEDIPTSSSDSRSRSSAISSTFSSRQSNDNDSPSSKDYSTPYSSISSEAQIRLNRLREASAERKAATTDNLLTPASAESRAPVRRRTTDLSHIIESTSSYNKTPATKTSTSSNTYTNNLPKEMPTPPGRRKVLTQSSLPEETVTLRLGSRSNSFNLSDNSNSSRESSISPVPPRRAKTPSLEETVKEPPVSKVQLKLPKVKISDSSDDARDNEKDDSKPKKLKKKRLLIQGVQEVMPQLSPDESDGSSENSDAQSADVAFIIQVKSTRKKKKEDDDETMSMTTTTDTTETTLVDANEYNQTASGINSWEYEELKKETDRLREKCDKLEKEKGEFLTRRVANLEAPKIQSTEYLKLQQRVNQLATTNEDLKDEKKDLDAKVRELETELASRPSTDILQRTIAELRSKLSSAEAQIEQIHEEKREAIQQMKDMQEEFEELQDNFREDQSEEFATVKKELDEASKNCRLLQFKLRKVEKRADQLEAEKNDLESRVDSAKNSEKIANLEKELSELKSDYDKLLRESKTKGGGLSLSPGVMKKKSPVLTKAPSGEAVEPPIPSDIDSSQLLRDLQSTLERESDLREQLKFAEEEVTSLRQRINRIEDENESLLIQIKKMSAKSRSDISTGNKAHDNQINGEKLDASELKIQLEINDQESKILRRKVEELENSNGRLSKELQVAEDKLFAFEKGTSSVTKSKSVDEVSLLRRKIIEKEREVERLQTELLAVASKNKNKMARGKSVEAEDSSKRQEAELRVELKKTQSELSKIKADSESKRKILEDELAKSRNELDSQYGKVSQLAEMNKNLVLQMEKFKQDMLTMKEQYETIQDDFVIKNSQLTSIKEERESALQKLKKEYSTIDKELQALRETFNTRQDTWIKEKLAMQERVKEYEQRERKFSSIPGDKDSIRLKRLLDESSKELDTKKHELSSYKDQIIFMQRENDELRRQLEDFEKVSQVQMRSLSLTEPSNRSDQELKVFREKMLAEEKTHRNEIAQMKLRYEQQYALKSEEMSSLQSQLSRAKRERDTFRQMVDSAQRAISELKSRDSSSRRDSISGLEEAATGARAAVVSLQDRITSLEDDLSDARRETSRAKTELATEKSTWEMKLGELQQKINELEEDRLLGSGRNRAAGQRTRLELAWQKERDEQQRRLKEATTLARDLKTTLLEYERERDRDRMENKRRIDQLKGTMEEDQEELRRKIGETQGDLLELRDAHAKLRTANEKLRRDREKLEKERDITMKKEIEIRRINAEREKLVEDLMAKIMTSQGSNATAAETIRYLQSIKGLKVPEEPTNYKDRKRSNFRRAASVGENEERQSQESLKSSVSAYGQEHYGGRNMRYNTTNSSTLTLPSRGRTPVGSSRNVSLDVPGSQYNPTGSLYRKSLSLEQTVAMPDEQKIWKGDSEAGSASSIASMEGYQSRGSSVDRLSTMSSKSEKPKSSSLVKKVKKLVKSKSIEESTTAAKVVQAGVKVAGVGSSAGSGVGSDVSLNYDSDRDNAGKKLKDKVKGIFKRSNRSPSVERPKVAPQPPPRSRESTPKKDTPVSTQRPLMPTESQQRPLMPLKR